MRPGTLFASVRRQMMPWILDLSIVKRIAEDVVAHMEEPSLAVVGANVTTGGSAYVELTMAMRGRRGEPEGFVVSANRGGGELALRNEIAAQLREHLGLTSVRD